MKREWTKAMTLTVVQFIEIIKVFTSNLWLQCEWRASFEVNSHRRFVTNDSLINKSRRVKKFPNFTDERFPENKNRIFFTLSEIFGNFSTSFIAVLGWFPDYSLECSQNSLIFSHAGAHKIQLCEHLQFHIQETPIFFLLSKFYPTLNDFTYFL